MYILREFACARSYVYLPDLSSDLTFALKKGGQLERGGGLSVFLGKLDPFGSISTHEIYSLLPFLVTTKFLTSVASKNGL